MPTVPADIEVAAQWLYNAENSLGARPSLKNQSSLKSFLQTDGIAQVYPSDAAALAGALEEAKKSGNKTAVEALTAEQARISGQDNSGFSWEKTKQAAYEALTNPWGVPKAAAKEGFKKLPEDYQNKFLVIAGSIAAVTVGVVFIAIALLQSDKAQSLAKSALAPKIVEPVS